jgi:hypothetical protein
MVATIKEMVKKFKASNDASIIVEFVGTKEQYIDLSIRKEDNEITAVVSGSIGACDDCDFWVLCNNTKETIDALHENACFYVHPTSIKCIDWEKDATDQVEADHRWSGGYMEDVDIEDVLNLIFE